MHSFCLFASMELIVLTRCSLFIPGGGEGRGGFSCIIVIIQFTATAPKVGCQLVKTDVFLIKVYLASGLNLKN